MRRARAARPPIDRKENAMRKSWTKWIGMAALLMAMPLTAQQTAKEAEKEAGTPAEYERLLKPADKHEILGRFVGSWKGDLKVLLYGTPSEGIMPEELEAHWIMKDNFIEMSLTQHIRDHVVNGKILLGYNGSIKKFYQLFLTDGEPRGTYSQGVLLRSKNALVFRGMEDDPVSGDSFERRDVYTFVDKDKIMYELYYTFVDGSEIKPVEGYLTRVKDKP
jgi:hypothetical protein